MIRRPKSITTDYRPPGARQNPPLERSARPGAAASPDCWVQMSASARREIAEHDKNVAGMSLETHVAAFQDLRRKGASNQKDPIERWEMNRKAAHLRAILAHQEGKAA